MNAPSKDMVRQQNRTSIHLQQLDIYMIAVERAVEGLSIAVENMALHPAEEEYHTLCVMTGWAWDTLRRAAKDVGELDDKMEAAEGEVA